MGSSGNSASFWNFGDARDDPIHRIHSYPAKFPAFITTKALEFAEQQGVHVSVVADVFCGCGTTAVEAKRNGKNFWGTDINPVASLIARVKTHHYRDKILERYFNSIKDEFFRTDRSIVKHVQISDRIQYWFEEQNIIDLVRLDRAIRLQTPASSLHRSFFLCGFSNILKPTSLWLTKSIKPQRDLQKSQIGVMQAFENQFDLMRSANSKNLFPVPKPQVCIQTQDFLTAKEPDELIDLIVTSPPYVTSYNYADIHQLSTMWLRFASDYRVLRKNMLGNHYNPEPPNLVEIRRLGKAAETTYYCLLGKDKSKAYSVARYFIEIDKAVAKCWRMLKQGGIAVFVIGNTQYKHVKIDNADYLLSCMKRSGFISMETVLRKVSRKNMTPYRDDKGRFTRDSTLRKVYGEEFVVIGIK